MLPKFVLAAACLALVQATFIIHMPKEGREREESYRGVEGDRVENVNTKNADILKIDVNAEMQLIDTNTVTEKSTAPAPVNSCDATKCEDDCSSMGFPGGECVSDRCKCDVPNLKPASIAEFLSARASVSTCNLRWCEQTCRRLGFSGGVCVGDRCKCDALSFLGPAPTMSPVSDQLISRAAVRTCKTNECGQNCQRMGYHTGACADGQCKCDTMPSHNPSLAVYGAPASLGSCTNAFCAAFCHLHGYPHGICINANQCLCYK